MPRLANLTPNTSAFLDMIAHSELGDQLLAKSDDGYNVVVGSTAAHPVLFAKYDRHPHILVPLKHKDGTPILQPDGTPLKSSAAGRGQILAHLADFYMAQLHLPDFGPVSQDQIILQLIHECHAEPLIEGGHFAQAVAACSSRWASLPGNTAGQHQNALADLQAFWQAKGGRLAANPIQP